MKKIIIILAVVLTVAMLCFISWSYGYRRGMKDGGFTSSMAELIVTSSKMEEQMANADCNGAKQAISDYLNAIDKYKDIGNPMITRTSYLSDSSIGHLRLAVIEKKLGNQQESAKNLKMAKVACLALGRKNCSNQEMRDFFTAYQKKWPMACFSEK